MVLGGDPVFAFMGLNGPSMQSLMTRRVGADQQGRLQGVNGSVMGLTGIVGPPLFTNVFAAGIATATRAPFPGAPFVLAAMILVAAAFVTERATRVASEALPGAS